MIAFRESYQKYFKDKYKSEWMGDILNINYLTDINTSIDSLYDIEKSINPEFHKNDKKSEPNEQWKIDK